mmetsp:Transcript_145/g.358  ORF Transcript_145/g.358 Transcript_145/m.358 type:complete len:207 (-) Transcript_145:536-1156(-)
MRTATAAFTRSSLQQSLLCLRQRRLGAVTQTMRKAPLHETTSFSSMQTFNANRCNDIVQQHHMQLRSSSCAIPARRVPLDCGGRCGLRLLYPRWCLLSRSSVERCGLFAPRALVDDVVKRPRLIAKRSLSKQSDHVMMINFFVFQQQLRHTLHVVAMLSQQVKGAIERIFHQLTHLFINCARRAVAVRLIILLLRLACWIRQPADC